MSCLNITDQNFEAEVNKSGQPVLVDFWAPWCGPCQIQSSIVEELAKTLAAKVKIGKLNVDENPRSTNQFNIMSIPTILLFWDGKVAKQLMGVQSKETLIDELNQLVK